MGDDRKRLSWWKCGCGKTYTLETLPEQCECSVRHFGNLARASGGDKDVYLKRLEMERELNA